MGATDIGITGLLTTGASQQGPAGITSGTQTGAGRQAGWQTGSGAQVGVGAQTGAGLQTGCGAEQTAGVGVGHLLVVLQLDAQVPLPLVLQRMRLSKPPA
ncbi:MAG: hypothetical protein AAFU85_29495 [Planctomycetota bacterium]